jgi:hypothetical protein
MKTDTSHTPDTSAPGTAGAPRRAHAINAISLELNAATEVRSHDDGSWATVFAIHNKYRGKDKAAKPVPISVKFGPNTVTFALAAIRKGTHFTVGGSLDFDGGEKGKDFYRINADQLSVHSSKIKREAGKAA